MLTKVKEKLMLMWERSGLALMLLLILALALTLNRKPVTPEEPTKAPSISQTAQTGYELPLGYQPTTNFGWQESLKTKTWRYSPSLAFNVDEGQEIKAPSDGRIIAEGEKIFIEHGTGYRSEIWPVRAYFYEGEIAKGESIGQAYNKEVYWKLTYYNEPIDPLSRVRTEP